LLSLRMQTHSRILPTFLVIVARKAEEGHLVMLYKNLVLSVVDYALPMINISQNLMGKLERLQNACLRIITGCPRSTPVHVPPISDSIFPEFIPHARSALRSWFCVFLNSCIRQLKILKIWRRALVVAIPKPEKPLGDPKSYHPVSLLCVPFKIIERLIYVRVEPIINLLLPQEQAASDTGGRP